MISLETFLANEFRRLFYILSSISSLGSIDAVMSSLSQQRKGHSPADGFLAVASVTLLLHFVAFLVTILMSGPDTLIAVKGGQSNTNTNWAFDALQSQVFSRNLKLWKGLETVRFVCALIGWFG